MAGLVDAFDAENAVDFFQVGENGLQLALVGNFEVGVDARIGAVGTAFQVVNVGTGAADDGGDFGEQAGAVASADGELHGEGGGAGAAPLDGDAALGLIHHILHVWTRPRVHRAPPPTPDLPH